MAGVVDSVTRVVLIVDLVGSTEYRVRNGDAVADRMLMLFEQCFEESVADFDGRVVANHGDGFLSSFASATAALASVVSFRRGLAALPIDAGVPAVRAGIAAGDVVERGREMYGMPVVVAARLEGLAEPDEVLCTDVVRALAGSRSPVGFHNRRTLELKGLPEDVSSWTVIADELPGQPLVASAAVARKSFPATPNRFIGRDHELSSLGDLIQPGTMVTLVGPGGVGKTRLSLELAHASQSRFPDGVWFVPLEPAVVIEEVVATIGRTMRLPSSVLDGTPERLADALDGVEALLVLDNCEQATSPIGDVVTHLLRSESRLSLLCSSRESLTVPAEIAWQLRPLPYPEAFDIGIDLRADDSVSLFIDRARTVDASREFDDEELVQIAEIVRRLEGLPLAIELAASRLNVLSPAEMADRAADLFGVLSQHDSFRPDRHSAMEATVDWSVSLLSDEERQALVSAAVFVGGATLEAVEHVCRGVEQPVIDLLASLVRKSLLRKEGDRFVMLGSIREVLLSRTDESDRVAAARSALVGYYAGLAEEASATVQPTPEWLSLFGAEHQNFANALEIAIATDENTALQMTGRLALSWVLTGQSREGDRIFSRVIESVGNVDPHVRAAALRGAAMAASLGGRYERSAELTAEARRLFVELDRPIAVAYCDYWTARDTVVQCHHGLIEPGRLGHAYELLLGAMTSFRDESDLAGELLAFPYLGWARLLEGDHAAAEAHTREMIGLADTIGATLIQAYARAHASFIRLSLGDLDRALADMKVAAGELEHSGDRQNLVIICCVNTALQIATGDEKRAVDAAVLMLDHALECDSSEWEAPVLALAAHVAATRGHWSVAGRLVSLLERLHPNWRVGLRNTGVDPALTLEHLVGPIDTAESVLNYPSALRLVRKVLEEV